MIKFKLFTFLFILTSFFISYYRSKRHKYYEKGNYQCIKNNLKLGKMLMAGTERR